MAERSILLHLCSAGWTLLIKPSILFILTAKSRLILHFPLYSHVDIYEKLKSPLAFTLPPLCTPLLLYSHTKRPSTSETANQWNDKVARIRRSLVFRDDQRRVNLPQQSSHTVYTEHVDREVWWVKKVKETPITSAGDEWQVKHRDQAGVWASHE